MGPTTSSARQAAGGTSPYATKDRSTWDAWHRQKNADVALNQLATGDFNGDGVDDIFRATGGGWYVTYGTGDRSAWGAWTRVKSSNVRQDSLALADTNADRRMDVLFHSNVDGTISPRRIGH
jgi:FG-GAP-like repeat